MGVTYSPVHPTTKGPPFINHLATVTTERCRYILKGSEHTNELVQKVVML